MLAYMNMLRSIFSLIQRIIDNSDKKYTNTKSKAVLYSFTNSDHIMDLNMKSNLKNHKRNIKSLHHAEMNQIEKPEKPQKFKFSINTEQGDVITCKHESKIDFIPNNSGSKKELQRISFSNNEETVVDAEIQPNVKELVANIPKKHPQFTTKGSDQISVLMEQIDKMKTGLERLHEIALQFNYSECFNQDINYLVNNIRPHLEEKKAKNRDVLTPKD